MTTSLIQNRRPVFDTLMPLHPMKLSTFKQLAHEVTSTCNPLRIRILQHARERLHGWPDGLSVKD